MKGADQSKDPKTQKGPSMAKAEKSSRPKAVATTFVKMGKDGKGTETNGSLANRNAKPKPVPIHVTKVNIGSFRAFIASSIFIC